MGDYIYKVSRRRKVNALNAPGPIYVSTYAYKPYGRLVEDMRMTVSSGASRCEKDWSGVDERDVHVVHAYTLPGKRKTGLDPRHPNPVICFRYGCGGTFWDGLYSLDEFLVGEINKVKGRWVYTPRTTGGAA